MGGGKGRRLSQQHRERIRLAHVGLSYPKPGLKGNRNSKGKNLGSDNVMWKGDQKLGRQALHEYVRWHLPKPDFCEMCNIKPPLDLANKTGIYNREFVNWYYLCRRCHMKSDGRFKNLKQFKEGA